MDHPDPPDPVAWVYSGRDRVCHRPEENFWHDDHYVTSLELSAPGGNAEKAFTEAFVLIDGREPIEMRILAINRDAVRFEGKIRQALLRTGPITYQFEYGRAKGGGGQERSKPYWNRNPRFPQLTVPKKTIPLSRHATYSRGK